MVPIYRASTFLALLILTLYPLAAKADCVGGEPAQVKITVKSCEAIDPLTDQRLKQPEQAQQMSEEFMLRLFKGALVTLENGSTYMYPTAQPDACAGLTPGAEVEKIVSSTCCDTGKWGKCLLGGRFMHDVGGEPVNAFQ